VLFVIIIHMTEKSRQIRQMSARLPRNASNAPARPQTGTNCLLRSCEAPRTAVCGRNIQEHSASVTEKQFISSRQYCCSKVNALQRATHSNTLIVVICHHAPRLYIQAYYQSVPVTRYIGTGGLIIPRGITITT